MNDGVEAPHAHQYPRDPIPLRAMLGAIPPKAPDPVEDADAGIAAEVAATAQRRSEARRDAILAVCLAIKRRGDNPMTDWATKDSDTAYAIADMLIALE